MRPATGLLAGDAGIPHRDRLLDPGGVAELLSPRLGRGRTIRIDRCERLRATYRVGQSLRVVYAVEAEGVRHVIAGRTFVAGRSEKAYRRALPTATSVAGLNPVILADEVDTVFWLFPNDRKITGLPGIVAEDPQRHREADPPWSGTELVAYVPERAATLRCLDDTGTVVAYAKVYAADEPVRAREVHERLVAYHSTRTPGLRWPRMLGYRPMERTLIEEPMLGRPLSTLRGAELLEGIRLFGRSLAQLHCLPPLDATRFRRFDADRLEAAAMTISLARPDVGAVAMGLAESLTAVLKAPGEPPVCLHGDVHFKNVIVQEEGAALVDLDDVSGGSPAADLGSVLGSIAYARCVEELSMEAEARLAESFLAGYRLVRPLPDEAALRWHMAAALLTERARRSVTRVRPAGLARLAAVLDMAADLIPVGAR